MLEGVFNVTGGEVIIIILAALVVLGPDKLPDVMRRAGKLYGELRKMSDGFQSEIRTALDEPTKELRETAEMARSSFTGVVDTVRTAVNPGAAVLSSLTKPSEPKSTDDKPAAADGSPPKVEEPAAAAETPAAFGAPIVQVAEPEPVATRAPATAAPPAPPPLAAPLPPPNAPPGAVLAAPPLAAPAPLPPPLPAPQASPAAARNGHHP